MIYLDTVKKVEKFNFYEKLYFRVTLAILGIAVSLFIVALFSFQLFTLIPKALINLTVTVLVISGLNFFLAVIRIIKYLINIAKLENNIGILRSAITLIISPISFIILYILLIIMAFSSCSVQ